MRSACVRWIVVAILLLTGCGNQAPPVTTELGEAVINGATLQYDVSGEGHPLVLVHGGFMDRRMWEGQLDVFARHFRVVRINLRGFQRGQLPDSSFSYVEDLKGLLTHLDVGPVYLLGLSLGGMVAIDFTTAYPDMVDGLILVGTPLRGLELNDPEGSTQKVVEMVRAYQRGAVDSAVILALELPIFSPASPNPAVERRMARMIHDNMGVWLRSLSLVEWDTVAAADRVGSITVPTLILVGDKDIQGVRTSGDSLEARIAGSTKVVIKGASHHINMEEPEAFNRAVVHFLEELH